MTLSIKETGVEHRCKWCRKFVVGVVHNGQVLVRAGRMSVVMVSGSVTCPGCGQWNHIEIADSERDVVR